MEYRVKSLVIQKSGSSNTILSQNLKNATCCKLLSTRFPLGSRPTGW